MALILPFVLALTPSQAPAEGFSARVPYGGEISQTASHKLVYGAGWIQALQQAADNLRENQAVRMAELDSVQRMAMAAMLEMFGIRMFNSLFLLDDNGQPYTQEEGESTAFISLHSVDEATLTSFLSHEGQRQLYEEMVLEINSLVEQGLSLTSEAAQQRAAMRLLEAQNGSVQRSRVPILSSKPDYAPELEQINNGLEACFNYLELIGSGSAWLDRQNAEQTIDQCLALYPDCLAFLIAKAQLLMRQDRTVTAMRMLSDIDLPELVWTMDEYLKDNLDFARSSFRVSENLQARFLQSRSLAWLGSAEPGMAETDLSRALDMCPDRADLWLSRGAVRQVLQDYENMCLDYYQACKMGLCLGLSTARDNGHCLNQEP